jgi:hypothetical protein
VKKFWQFTFVGVVEGLIVGWLLSLVSGDYYVTIGGGILGTIVGVVLGIVHRNDA